MANHGRDFLKVLYQQKWLIIAFTCFVFTPSMIRYFDAPTHHYESETSYEQPAKVILDTTAHTGEESAVRLSPEAQEILRRIKALTPTFPAPPTHILASPGSEALPVRLIGVDLKQRSTRLDKENLRLNGKLRLKVTGYWLSPVMPLESTIPADIRLWSHNSRITKSQEITVGPIDGEESWMPGQVYKQEYQINLKPISSVFSGNIHMTVNLLSRKNGKFVPNPLQSLSLYLSPNVGRGRVEPSVLQAAVGETPRDLSVSFRLGNGAEHKVPIPARWQKGNARIAVVSAFGFGSVDQGEQVCEVVVETKSGQHTWELTSGVETAQADYDYYPAGTLDHDKIQIVESTDSEYLSELGQPFRKHKYIGFLEVPETLGTIKSITFNSESSVIYEVFDVLLLPASS